jgi:hypothetical protein
VGADGSLKSDPVALGFVSNKLYVDLGWSFGFSSYLLPSLEGWIFY